MSEKQDVPAGVLWGGILQAVYSAYLGEISRAQVVLARAEGALVFGLLPLAAIIAKHHVAGMSLPLEAAVVFLAAGYVIAGYEFLPWRGYMVLGSPQRWLKFGLHFTQDGHVGNGMDLLVSRIEDAVETNKKLTDRRLFVVGIAWGNMYASLLLSLVALFV